MVISCTSRLASSTCTCNGAKAAKKTWAFNEEKKDQKLVSDTISPWKSWLLLFFLGGGGGGNPCIRKFHGDFYDPWNFGRKNETANLHLPEAAAIRYRHCLVGCWVFLEKKFHEKLKSQKTVPWKTPRYLPASQYMTLLKLLYIIYVSKI